MPAASAASSPCAEVRRQGGAALILAILTVALVAALAAAVVGDYGAAVASLSGRHDQAQARQLARGAIDWARNVLAEDKRTSQIDTTSEAWATRVPPTPVEEGEVAGELEDLSGRFDLNSLVQQGVAAPDQVAAYESLLAELGFDSSQAIGLAQSLVDWLDNDDQTAGPLGAEAAWYALQTPPRRPANAPLVDVDELTLVRGYDAGVLAALRPYVTALPQPAPLNVNTASAEVLAAMLPSLGLNNARIMAAQQQSAPFKDIADFQARLPQAGITVSNTRFAVVTRYFLASGRARFGEATTRMQVLLDRQDIYPLIVWQKIL